jgi:hypothetical protein
MEKFMTPSCAIDDVTADHLRIRLPAAEEPDFAPLDRNDGRPGKTERRLEGGEIRPAIHDSQDVSGSEVGHQDILIHDVTGKACSTGQCYSPGDPPAKVIREEHLVTFVVRGETYRADAPISDDPRAHPGAVLDRLDGQKEVLIGSGDGSPWFDDKFRK